MEQEWNYKMFLCDDCLSGWQIIIESNKRTDENHLYLPQRFVLQSVLSLSIVLGPQSYKTQWDSVVQRMKCKCCALPKKVDYALYLDFLNCSSLSIFSVAFLTFSKKSIKTAIPELTICFFNSFLDKPELWTPSKREP